jgi:ZIP family zinc transporter
LLALALATEMLSLGLAVAAALGAVGYRRGRALATSAAVFSALLLGALTGSVAAPLLTGAFLEGVLSFGLAALLFLVTEELLVEAHAEGEIPGATALFFAGFLFFLLLGMM